MIKNDRLAILRVLAMVSSQSDQHWRCCERKPVFSPIISGLSAIFFFFFFFFGFVFRPGSAAGASREANGPSASEGRLRSPAGASARVRSPVGARAPQARAASAAGASRERRRREPRAPQARVWRPFNIYIYKMRAISFYKSQTLNVQRAFRCRRFVHDGGIHFFRYITHRLVYFLHFHLDWCTVFFSDGIANIVPYLERSDKVILIMWHGKVHAVRVPANYFRTLVSVDDV